MKSELKKHTLNLRAGDWEALADVYTDTPTSIVVRRIISSFVDQMQAGSDTTISTNIEVNV